MEKILYKRKNTRLRTYDYSLPGVYALTLCVGKRVPSFGRIRDGECAQSVAGKIVERTWNMLPGKFPSLRLVSFMVMPEHVHAMVEFLGGGRAPFTLGDVVGYLKSVSTKQIRREIDPWFSWQSNYWERVMCSEESIARYHAYIQRNPRVEWERMQREAGT